MVPGVKQCRSPELVVDSAVENQVEIHSMFTNDQSCTCLRAEKSTAKLIRVHQFRALTIGLGVLLLHASTVERVGENKTLPGRSRLGDMTSWGNPERNQTRKNRRILRGKAGVWN